MSLEKEFVPYELAVKLKELGFDEKCLAYYHEPSRIIERFQYSERPVKNSSNWNNMYIVYVSPLWQQDFDWFEEKHNLHSHIDNIVLSFGLIDCRNNDIKINKYISSEDCYKTKLEVKQACLEKLIEIVSCKSDN